jgi:hypothetical protein
VQAQVQSQAIRANFGGRICSRKGLYPSASVVVCQCLCTSAPYSSSSTCCSTRRANEGSLRNFQKHVFLRRYGDHWTIKLHSLMFKIKHILFCVLRKAYRRLRHLQAVLHTSPVTYINLGLSMHKSLLRSILRTSQQLCSSDSYHKVIKISE